jgi:hypothetical protein
MSTQKKTTRQQRRAIARKDRKRPEKLGGVMTPKQFTRDARHQVEGATVLALANQIRAETIVCNLSSNALYGVMVSYVTLALQKGFSAVSTDPIFPFYAAQFGWGIMNAYATGNAPQLSQIPYWMLCLCQAISPSNVPFQQGTIAYSWAIDSASAPGTSQVPIGYEPYGYEWNVNEPTNPAAYVNNFPISQEVDASLYTDALGAAAFSQVIQFMAADSMGGAGSVSRLVPTSLKTGFETNVSSFCVNASAEGNGWAGIGGFVDQAQLEVPIFFPLFAVFSPNIIGNQTDRFFNLATAAAGDSVFLGGALSELFAEQTWSMKRYPKFHSVDFLEFGDVLANWVSSIQGALTNDPQTQTSQVEGVDLSGFMCPLTLQEVLLLLRNVIMSAFKETQPLVQALYPRQPASSMAVEFVPYVASATTCALNAGGMLLPQLFIENIRALVARHVAMNVRGRGNNASQKQTSGKADVQWWIPVLGQYQGYHLNPTDYGYTDTSTGIVYPAFSTNALARIKKDPKTKTEMREMLAEVPISLVDGNTTLGSTVVYAYINDPGELKVLETLWNDWVMSSGVQNFSSPIGVLGTELGISVLTSIAMTRHWVPSTLDVHGRKLAARDDGIIDVRMEKRLKRAVNTVYAQQDVVADSSQSVILSAAYEGLLNVWILPVNKATFDVTNISDSTAFPRWQSIMGEPFSATYSAGSTGQLMSMQHASYASRMTRTRDGPPSDTDKLLTDLAATGRGGILSGLAASFISSIFPAAAGIANTVASMVPI